VGAIKGGWWRGEQKEELLMMLTTAKTEGVSNRRSCDLLMIQRRRITRWQSQQRRGIGLNNQRPGPAQALNRLLPVEREQVLALARRTEYADLSHRQLTVLAWERNLVWVSFSTVYRLLREGRLMTVRCQRRLPGGRRQPPERRELTGPNQRWCWDISYLLTLVRGIYLYLYIVLDEYSRKILAWQVSATLTAGEAKRVLDAALVVENILDLPEGQRPEIINDHGRQLKAKPVRELLAQHEMPQRFARPRTPNDNPYVEATFSTVKRDPDYPERFRDQPDAENYFREYVPWYNTRHYHSGNEYVTPDQAHSGLRAQIVAERNRRHAEQRKVRKEVWQNKIKDSVSAYADPLSGEKVAAQGGVAKNHALKCPTFGDHDLVKVFAFGGQSAFSAEAS
jgi:transposase InsO family protein